jgi:hypothetical protein
MDTVKEIILVIHSINRWLVVLIGVIAAIKFLVGWLRNSTYQPIDSRLMSAYAGSLDLQLLLGIILLIGGGFEQIEHAVTMIIAVVLAHLSRIWRDKPDSIKFRNNFMAITLGLLLIFAGVSLLPNGWALK